MKKPTLKDIAQAADVSVTTASLVLSGKGRISESVRRQILDAAARLGYGRRRFGDGTGSRPVVGVLFNIDERWAFTWRFLRPIVAEIDAYFSARSHSVAMIPISIGMADSEIERRVTDEGCTALFSLHYGSEPLFSSLEGRGIPVVIIMNGRFQDRFHSILVDDFQGAYEGAMHLIKLGHRELAYIDTERIDLPVLTTDRFYGFKKALDESGIAFDQTRHITCEAANTQLLEAQLREALEAPARPTAVFAIDDDIAIRVAAVCGRLGLRIPEDLSIIAPGDLLDYSSPWVIPVTTLRINTALMGRLASDMMARRMESDSEDIHVLKVKQQLAQRGSTRALQRGRGERRAGDGSPRDRVLAAFERRPAKLAKWLGASPEFIAKARSELGLDEEAFRRRIGDDLRWVAPPSPARPGGGRADAFGVERRGAGYGQPTDHPLAGTPTVAALRDFAWPDPEAVDLAGLRPRIAAFGGEFAVASGDWSPFFHDAIDLVGLESLACLMYDDPVFVETLLGRIVDYYAAVCTRAFEEAGDLMDIFLIRNDFGAQTGPLVGPEHFRKYLSPCLKRLAELGRRYGLKVMLSSSGSIRPLIPAIVESGVDALHVLQPDCPGMQGASIKKDFGRSLVLSGGIDARGALLTGGSAEVRARVREALDALAAGGGYLAAPSVDALTEDVPVANVLAMYDAIAEWDGNSHGA